MELRDPANSPATVVFAETPWAHPRLSSYLRGLVVTELIDDVRTGEPITMLAPTTSAFDQLACPLDTFLGEPELCEVRVDFFEYTVLRGHHFAGGRSPGCRTVQGASLDLVEQRVIGRFGASNIIQTVQYGPLLVHLTDNVIYPHGFYDRTLVRPLRLVP